MSKRRIRLDAALVKTGLAPDISVAQELITQGVILVNGSVALTNSRMVSNSDTVLLSMPARFVSRGGEKLEAALVAFDIDIADQRVLDAGASTGGFTDCVLQRGAREVVALDVGKAQLHDRLVRDPRVTVVDSVNVRTLSQSSTSDLDGGFDVGFDGDCDGGFDVVVADLSFISLQKVSTALVGVLRHHGNMILLVKPQFEAEKAEVDKGAGVITDIKIHERTLAQVVGAYESMGMTKMGVIESPLRGADGNTEFLLHLRKGSANKADSVSRVD